MLPTLQIKDEPIFQGWWWGQRQGWKHGEAR